MEKMRITSSYSKVKLVRSGKGFITSLGIKTKTRPKKIKKSRYAIGNVIRKELLNIIKEFEQLPYEGYDKSRPKHEPTDRYFYLERHIEKCTMRYDALNSHINPVKAEMAGMQLIPTSHVKSMDKSELKEFQIEKTLSQICSTDEDKLKIIVNDECSTEEYESESVQKTINEQ